MRYAIVIEKGPENYSAYVPDLPGCVSTGSTVSEVEKNIKEAISFHIDGLKEDGLPVPEPSTICEYIETTWKVYYQGSRKILKCMLFLPAGLFGGLSRWHHDAHKKTGVAPYLFTLHPKNAKLFLSAP